MIQGWSWVEEPGREWGSILAPWSFRKVPRSPVEVLQAKLLSGEPLSQRCPPSIGAVLGYVGTNSWSLGHRPPCAFSESHTQAWGDGFWGDLGLGLIPRAGVGLPRWVRGTHSGKLGKGILSEKRVNQGVEEPEWEIA